MPDNIFRNDKDNKNAALKGKLLDFFIRNGNSTTNDLSKEFNLSGPTISKLINEMAAAGFINEYGKLETGEGRRPILYGLNPESGFFVGVDLKPTSLNLALMNFRGDLVDLTTDEPFTFSNSPESLGEFCQHINRFIERTGIPRDKILNVNVNISGRVNPDTGYSYTVFNFTEMPVSVLMAEQIDCHVDIDNDSRAMAYGEFMQGCVNGERNIVFINLSWGLGMGLIIDGSLYKGKSGFAGELGHIHAFGNEIMCHCGKKGCLETEASGRAFYRLFCERIANGETSALSNMRPEDVTLDDLVRATNLEDPLCMDIIEGIGRKLGLHIASLINIFNPELVVLGGTLSLTGDYLLHAVRSAVLKHSLNIVNKDTQICLSKLGDRAGVIGACMLARNRWLSVEG